MSKLKIAPQFVFAIIHSELQNARTFIQKNIEFGNSTLNLRQLKGFMKKIVGFYPPMPPVMPALHSTQYHGGPAKANKIPQLETFMKIPCVLRG